ncbi:MAG: adenosylmethionine--8-amino-7-oxononanoate transaminase [Candidatus Auribacterota bacterium]
MNYYDIDKQFTWHPFTQMQDWMRDDILMIERGDGVWLYDIHGNRYIDGVSSLWVNVHGHRKKELDDAIIRQLGKVAHSTYLGLAHPPASELAAELISIAPDSLRRVFYSDNGSTAMEIALKIAYQYWQQKDNGSEASRKKFIKFTNAYHGDTIGSVSVGGIDLFHKVYRDLLFDTIAAPYPYVYRHDEKNGPCGECCLNELDAILEKQSGEIAAIVIEPEVQGASGMIMTPPGFMKGVEQLARKYGVLLILDEVATGFGRTGTMFAAEQENILPDIMAAAKSITGGYLPLSATLVSEEVFSGFLGGYEEQKTFFHGHTYTANPLACAVAIENLKLYKSDKIIQNVIARAEQAKKLFESFAELEHVGDIRQKGLMIGIELVRDKDTRQPYDWQEKIGVKVIEEARNHEIIIRPLGNVIVLMPPLCIAEDELNHLFEGTLQSIRKVTEK